MANTFTAAEIAQIEAARDLCPAGDVAPSSTGNWVPFYQTLSDLIEARIQSGTITGGDLQDLKNAQLWLDVAIGANGGTGMHSAFIRADTAKQLVRAYAQQQDQIAKLAKKIAEMEKDQAK